MKKIQSLFQRNYDGDWLVRDEVVPGSEWVLNGEGIATRKWDGICCMVQDRRLFKRYDAKPGKVPPRGFVPAQDPDPVTGHWPGWVQVGDGPDERWFNEAWWAASNTDRRALIPDGTYELCGPKVQGNPEGFQQHILIRHGSLGWVSDHEPPRTFDGIREWFTRHDVEGIVWHRPNGGMVKIKAKDFGLRRGGS